MAQAPTGIVSDSVTNQPIAGAVATLLDSTGATLARFITNARGEYRFPGFTLGRGIRVVRMGYRPRELRLSMSRSSDPVNVRMTAIPMLLDQVSAVANSSCPRRSDRQAAFALLEQARAGLLNAVVARQTLPAAMTVLPFERHMDGASDRIDRQEVRIHSSARVTTSFNAVRSAADFVRDGFVSENGETMMYFGPDVDVLLDANFTAGYCFQLRAPERAAPTVVGLRFVPARRSVERVDIEGTLWVDTAARKLVSMEHRYLALTPSEPVQPGGRATFWELPNGVVFIDKWNFRLPVPHVDTSYSHENQMRVRVWHSAREPGGEVATAKWPDGQTYQGPLGILNARAVGYDMKPAAGIVVRLDDTDYIASPDSQGFFAIANLLPGPYTAVVVHPALVHLGITLPTSLRFVAVRDSIVQETMAVPDPWLYVMKSCTDTVQAASRERIGVYKLGEGTVPVLTDTTLLISVITPDKKPVGGARWRLSKGTETPLRRIVESRETDEKGQARSCLIIHEKDEIEVAVWRPGETPRTWRFVFKSGQRYWFTLPFETPP